MSKRPTTLKTPEQLAAEVRTLGLLPRRLQNAAVEAMMFEQIEAIFGEDSPQARAALVRAGLRMAARRQRAFHRNATRHQPDIQANREKS